MTGRLWFFYRLVPILPLLLAGLPYLTAVEAATLQLSWTDVSHNEDGFKIERMASDGSFVQVGIVGTNVTSYTHSGLTSGVSYCYVVRAFNSAGTSDPSNGACGTARDAISSVNLTKTTNTGSDSPGSPGGSGTTNTSLTVSNGSRDSISPSSTTSSSSASASGTTNTSLTVSNVSPDSPLDQYLMGLLLAVPDFLVYDPSLVGCFELDPFTAEPSCPLEGKLIAQIYLGILARDAERTGFRNWLGALLAGLSLEQIVQGFLDSEEFQANFGSSLTNRQFVERMYNNALLRSSDPEGFSFWVGQLNSGQMTSAQVALSFLNSDEFQSLNPSQNRMNVSLLYFDILKRDPDAEGFSASVGALNSGVQLTLLINGFLTSAEYQAQF